MSKINIWRSHKALEYVLRYDMSSNLSEFNYCTRGKNISDYFYPNPKLICISYGTAVTSKSTTKKIPDIFNRWYILEKGKLRKNLHLLCWKKVFAFLAICGRALLCWNSEPGMRWRQDMISGSRTSRMHSLLLRLPTILSSCDRLWYSMASQTIMLGVRTVWRWITQSMRWWLPV